MTSFLESFASEFETSCISYIITELPNYNLIILAIYRPPSYNITDFLNFLDEKVNILNNKNCLIIGDMNIDLLSNNNYSETLHNIFISNNFYLCNETYYTRYSQTNESLLDYIALNYKCDKIDLNIIENSLSDHAIQILSLKSNRNKNTKQILYKKVHKTDYRLLRNRLDTLINRNNDQINTNELYNSIITAYNSSTYSKSIKIKDNSKPWFNEKIFNLIKQRDYYFHRKKKFPNNSYIQKTYNEYNNKVKKTIRETKKIYFDQKLNNMNSKNIWNCIKFILYNKDKSEKHTINKIKNKDNKIVLDQEEICEYINNYFANVGVELASKIQTSSNIYPSRPEQNSIILFPTKKLK